MTRSEAFAVYRTLPKQAQTELSDAWDDDRKYWLWVHPQNPRFAMAAADASREVSLIALGALRMLQRA